MSRVKTRYFSGAGRGKEENCITECSCLTNVAAGLRIYWRKTHKGGNCTKSFVMRSPFVDYISHRMRFAL